MNVNDDLNDETPRKWRPNWRKIALIGLPILLVIILLGWWGWASNQNSVENDGKSRQRDLVTLQARVATALSTCLDNSKIASQIAITQTAEVRKTIVDAVSAQYATKDGATSDKVTQVGIRNSFVAMQQRYPQVDTKVWDHLITVATGCRNEVKGEQDHLQQNAGVFDKWRSTGDLIDRQFRREFPTNDLVATNPLTGEVYHGKQAMAFLTRLIITGEAKTAIGNGTMPDQTLFPSAPATSPHK